MDVLLGLVILGVLGWAVGRAWNAPAGGRARPLTPRRAVSDTTARIDEAEAVGFISGVLFSRHLLDEGRTQHEEDPDRELCLDDDTFDDDTYDDLDDGW